MLRFKQGFVDVRSSTISCYNVAMNEYLKEQKAGLLNLMADMIIAINISVILYG